MTSLPDPTVPSHARIPGGLRIYAVGDIHGRSDLLSRMLAMIDDDLHERPPERARVVFLGDYLDRGADGAGVLDILLEGPSRNGVDVDWVCLCGNHEDALLDFLEDLSSGPLWLSNGGWTTVESYAGERACVAGDLRTLQGLLKRQIPHSHRQFLRGCRYGMSKGTISSCMPGCARAFILRSRTPRICCGSAIPF